MQSSFLPTSRTLLFYWINCDSAEYKIVQNFINFKWFDADCIRNLVIYAQTARSHSVHGKVRALFNFDASVLFGLFG